MRNFRKVPVYFAVFAVSFLLCLFLSFSVDKNYANLKIKLEKEANATVNTKVNSMILKINTYRKYNDEESVKGIVHDTLIRNSDSENEYIWINEIVNWNGGDNYAFRFVNPNFPETEGEMISTTLKDIPRCHPYLAELEGIKKNGEIYYQFYFKNYLNNDIEVKYSYAKLYKDYNWIIGCGIPESDLFEDATFTFKKEKQMLYLFYLILALLDIFICFIIYNRNKRIEQKL